MDRENPDAPEPPALDFETIKTMAQLARDLYVSITDDPYYTSPSNPTWWIKYMKAASAAHVPEPPALDAAEIARQLRLVISVECSPGEYVHRIANQAADLLAAQAKRLAKLENKISVWKTAAESEAAVAIKEGERAKSAEQRVAVERANGFAACREMAAKVAEGNLGWSEAGDTRAQTIAAAIRALIAPDETENHK